MDVTSPLKVRERKRRIWAEDASGNVIVDGKGGRDVWPDRYLATGPGGAWKIAAEVVTGGDKYLPLIDPASREVGRLAYVKRRGWKLHLGSGELIEAESGGGMLKALHCELPGFSSAEAPRLAPQRYFTLTLTDAALHHPLRDAITVAAVWISESTLASLISDSAGD